MLDSLSCILSLTFLQCWLSSRRISFQSFGFPSTTISHIYSSVNISDTHISLYSQMITLTYSHKMYVRRDAEKALCFIYFFKRRCHIYLSFQNQSLFLSADWFMEPYIKNNTLVLSRRFETQCFWQHNTLKWCVQTTLNQNYSPGLFFPKK